MVRAFWLTFAFVSVLWIWPTTTAGEQMLNLKRSVSISRVEDAVTAAVLGMRTNGPRLDEVIPGVKRSLDTVRLENKLHADIADLIGKYLVTYIDTVNQMADIVTQMYNTIVHSLHEQMLHLVPDGSNIHQLATNFINTLQGEYTHLLEQLLNSLGTGANNEKDVLTGSMLTIGETLLNNMLQGIDFTSIFNSLGNAILELMTSLPASGSSGSPRVISTIWNIITDTLGSIINSLGDKYSAFKDWIQNTLQAGLDFAQPHVDNIKELAQQVIDNISSMPQQAIIQALDFFRPWQDTLGPIFDTLMEVGGNLLP